MDQMLLCCGKLFFAELSKGGIVLECSQCGQRWVKGPDNTMIPASEGVSTVSQSSNGYAGYLHRPPIHQHAG